MKGRMKYVPPSVFVELEDLKNEKGFISDAEAFRDMARYSQVGREAERLMKLDFKHRPRKDKGWLF